MESAKLRILKETFESPFDMAHFRKFTKDFFNEPEMFPQKRRTGIWREYTEHISSYSEIGKYTDQEENKLIVLAVEIKKNRSVERARSMQRNFISKILDGNDYEAAIVAFYTPKESNWRLSFVRLDYSLTEKGLNLELTPARRYSYLLGDNEPNHTAQEQLLPIFKNDKHNPSLDDIEDAFSVEKVTKDFYKQYEQKYIELKEYLEGNSTFIQESKKLGFIVEKFSEQFAKKLMGQLAFLYFLQKKGWLGVRILPESHSLLESDYKKIYYSQDEVHRFVLDKVFVKTSEGKRKLSAKELQSITDREAEIISDCFTGTKFEQPWGSGNKRFIREILNFCLNKTNQNFFDKFLEPLFYDALNKKRKNHYFNKFNCKIPFLNGGLFEPLEGYNWRDLDFSIPNELFSNEKEKGKNADGIIDIFDRFNFTINEDEPLEKEVAVDPEMLGKIFENLLDVNDRKSKGAFYTPREIVHYMCQESLTNYLVTEVGVPYEEMREFIVYGELIRDADKRRNVGYEKKFTIKESIFKNIVNIDQALKTIRVADPAVGSGAFPLGMLSEISRLRNNITEYLVRKDREGALGKRYGEELIRKSRSSYKLKWDTIKNSIFAVDIEPSAIDIAKLRLWLSVIVDQEINEETPEPHPLPNLDMNIIVGNSLVDEYEGIKLFDKSVLERRKTNNVKDTENEYNMALQLSLLVDNSDELLSEMFQLQDRYFDEENEQSKKELKQKIDQLREDLIEYKLQVDGNEEGLKKYKEFIKNKQKPYLLWHLEFAKIFQKKGGFDIIIGNPPYVGEKGNKDIFQPINKTEFGKKYHQGRMDLFYFFFHKAIELGNKNAEINFITTNYYVTAHGGKKLRTAIKEDTLIRKLVNFNELRIFESALGQHNLITMLTKNKDIKKKVEVVYTEKKGHANETVLQNILSSKDQDTSYYSVPQKKLFDGKENYIRFIPNDTDEDSLVNNILEKIIQNGQPLKEFCNVNNGLRSGMDKYIDESGLKHGIFVLESDEVENIYKSSASVEDIVKPYYKNSNITKYITNDDTNLSVIYSTKKTDIKQYPLTFNYLSEYKEVINNKRWKESVPWFSLVRPRNKSIFVSPKIVCPQRSYSNTFGYNEGEWFAGSDVFYITLKNNDSINLKYVLALLNSKLYYLWLFHKGKRKGNVLELIGTPIKEVYFKPITLKEQKTYVDLVDKLIVLSKEQNQNSSDNQEEMAMIQNELDRLIYSLYGLSGDEINYVENFITNKEDE